MNLSEENLDDYIDLFLLGKLSSGEVKAFEEKIQADPDLAYEVRVQQHILEQTKLIGQKKRSQLSREIVQSIFEDQEVIHPIETPSKTQTRVILIAAGIAILIVSIFFIFNQDKEPSQLVCQDLTTLTLAEQQKVVISGARPTDLTPVEALHEAFRNSSFQEVILRADSILMLFPYDVQTRRIRGLALSQTGQLEAALLDFQYIYLDKSTFRTTQKCRAGILTFWTLVALKDKQGLALFFQRWQELGECPDLPAEVRNSIKLAQKEIASIPCL